MLPFAESRPQYASRILSGLRSAGSTGMAAATYAAPMTNPILVERDADRSLPWQLEMFALSLKKQQKLRMLVELLGPLAGERCLLISNGSDPGSLNYHLRAGGGVWWWAELEAERIPEMEELLGERVHRATPGALPFRDGWFERVVVVDVHEHVPDVRALNLEVARVLAPGGVVVTTTPNGDERAPVSVLKRWLGLTPASRDEGGFRVEELELMMAEAGLLPLGRGTHSRFFTELAELAFRYAKVLGRRRRGTKGAAGRPAWWPSRRRQIRRRARWRRRQMKERVPAARPTGRTVWRSRWCGPSRRWMRWCRGPAATR
jgi:SAM-dependent methyltransferase